MAAYFARRFLYMIATLLFISIIGFTIINLPAGTYMDAYMARLRLQGTSTSQAQMEAITQRFGLDKPLYVQYWKWITGFVRGDFGRSFRYERPVKELIGTRLAYTVLIAVATLLFVWAVAIPIGIYSATHQYSLGDHVFTFVGLAGVSVPSFMVALVLMVVAQRYFGQSVGGLFSPEYANAPWSLAKLLDFLSHLWIPVVVLGAGGTAGLTRMMRGNLLDVINMQYVQAARARGLPERSVIIKHAVRNAIHPLIMSLGASLPYIISGSMVMARVMGLPTTGPLYFNALRDQDMYLAGTFLMFLSILLVVGNFLSDVLLAWIDPRIQFE